MSIWANNVCSYDWVIGLEKLLKNAMNGARLTAVWSSDLWTWVRTWTKPRFEVQVLISGRPGPGVRTQWTQVRDRTYIVEILVLYYCIIILKT